MLRRILAILAILAAVPAGAGVVCSSTNKSCSSTTSSGGGGSSAFSALTSSTNTTAAMHVGTGASLDATGSGTIAATSAAALAANGANCSAGSYPLGVDATGAVESCTSALPGADTVTESMLKAVDAPADEECLTYESTGGDFEWQACGSGGGSPGGSDTQVQFNDSSAFGGDAGLTYNKTTNALSVGDNTTGGSIVVNATLGSENAVALTGTTGGNWTFGSGWTTPLASSAIHSSNGTATLQETTTTIVSGTTYKVVVVVTGTTVAGGFSVALGGVNSTTLIGANTGADGTYTDYITAGSTGKFTVTPVSAARFTISSVSWKAVTLTTGGVQADGNSEIHGSLRVVNDLTVNGAASVAGNLTTGPVTSSGAVTAGSSNGFTIASRIVLTSPAAGEYQFSNTGGLVPTNFYFGTKAGNAAPGTISFVGSASRSGTDTDLAGGLFTIGAGRGTGNSVPALVTLTAGALSSTSGTTAQTARTRFGAGASKVLTNNSAITILSATEAVTSATVGGIGGRLDYCIEVVDGTDVQQECGNVIWAGVNKAGAFTNNITEVSTQSVSAGTLATTWAISGANPALISINANSSLTPSTGFPRITYNYSNLGQQALAVQ